MNSVAEITPPATPDALLPAQKAAIIITALPEQEAGALLGQLGDKHIRAYVEATSQLRHVPSLLLERVIVEFLDMLNSSDMTIGPETAQEVLSRIMSPEAVSNVISEATGVKRSVWEKLNDVSDDAIADFVSRQHPRASSILLSRVAPEKAAAVIALLDADTAERSVGLLKDMKEVEPHILEMIGESIRADLLQTNGDGSDDPDALVGAIFDNLTERTREPLMKSLEEKTPDFARAVAKRMFLFDDIPTRVGIRDVPSLTRAVDQAVLKTAIAYARGRGSETSEFLVSNMSKRLAEQLEEAMAEMGEISSKVGEAAESELIKSLKSLVLRGEIQLVSAEDLE